MTYDYLKLISTIAGVFGLGLTIYLTLIKKSHKKPMINITIGIEKMYYRRWTGQKILKKNILYVFDKGKIENPIIFVPITIANKSSLPCSDIVIRVSFPTQFRIENSTFFEKGKKNQMLYVAQNEEKEKTLDSVQYNDRIQYTYTIEKLRIGEVIAIPHFMRAETTTEGASTSKSFHNERYNGLANYISSMPLHVAVYSTDIKSFEKYINIISVNGKDYNQAYDTLKKMVELSWEKQRPAPGFYLTSPILQFFKPKPYNVLKPIEKEYVEILISDLQLFDIAKKEQTIPIDRIKHIPDAFPTIFVPPWGLFGESFDLLKIGFVKIKDHKIKAKSK